MEATGATVTSISTADTLWVGTAGPDSSTVFTTGLVIMAEMPFSTLHIPNLRTEGQEHGRLHKVHILLTGPCLHVAGVPSRATVLPVLTTHSMGQLAAGPTSLQAWAAGLPYWAAGMLVTTNISNLEQGVLAGRHLLQASHHCVSLLTVPLSQTCEALRAAMAVVWAADSLWDGTAAPVPRIEFAAGIVCRTLSEVITGDITLQDLWVWQAEGGCDLLHPGYLEDTHFASSFLCVTLKPCRAAMNVVLTTHGLGKWTAAPGPSVEAAAGISFRAAHLHVTLHLLHWVSRQLGQEIRGVVLG